MQGAGGAAVVGYRKRHATQQIRENRQSRRVSNGDNFMHKYIHLFNETYYRIY